MELTDMIEHSCKASKGVTDEDKTRIRVGRECVKVRDEGTNICLYLFCSACHQDLAC